MHTPWLPSATHPPLTIDRLVALADVIRRARDEAADDHRPDTGETKWTLGVSRYERTCAALTWAQADYPWLRVEQGGGGGPVHFIASVGGYPFRFCAGDVDDISARYRQPSFPELEVQQRALALDDVIPDDSYVRIVIEDDADGRPDSIYLVEMDEQTDAPRRWFTIPRQAASNVTPIASPAKPVPIAPVVAEPIKIEKKKTDSGA